MSRRECIILVSGIIFGLICGLRAGNIYGEKHPNFETMELDTAGYSKLVDRCKSVRFAEEFADVVMKIAEPLAKEKSERLQNK